MPLSSQSVLSVRSAHVEKCVLSAGLEEQDGHLAKVEVNEMLGLVSHIAAKVSPDDAVPGRVIFLIKLLWETETIVLNIG